MMAKNPPPADPSAQRRSRRVLIILFLVVLAPVVLAYSLFLSGWRPTGQPQVHGELLSPARPLPDVSLQAVSGGVQALSTLRRQWMLLSFVRQPCAAECQARIDLMQRLRLAQGKEMRRVELVLIDVQGTRVERADLSARFPVVRVFGIERDALQVLARVLEDSDKGDPAGAQRLYLIDPIGNLVIRYAPDADPRGINKDLARLLRLSQIG